jgi:hypothetical protein
MTSTMQVEHINGNLIVLLRWANWMRLFHTISSTFTLMYDQYYCVKICRTCVTKPSIFFFWWGGLEDAIKIADFNMKMCFIHTAEEL